jgi:formylglycine-generating enzyme required for sulfatase activity
MCTTTIRAFDTSGNTQYLNITFRVPLSPDVIPQTVYVPAGTFLMGSNNGRPDEAPQRTVELSPYEIGVYEVTNAQFAVFANETGHLTTAEREMASYLGSEGDFISGVSWKNPTGSNDSIKGKEDHPVVHVSFHDTVEYCKWLSGRTGRRFRLPTEAEWERAARGSDGRKYPWGDTADPGRANYRANGGGKTPAGSYKKGKSEIGCYDMAGNVREWCADWYSMRPEIVQKDPKGPSDGSYRVVRGGSFLSGADMLRASARSDVDPEQTADDLGFRVAVTP